MSYTKIQTVYSDSPSPNASVVHAAVTAVLRLECRSPVVILGLDVLVHLYEIKADLPDIERGERYVAECWAEYVPPTGVVYKGEVQS
jgi:hypothetical protein